MTYSTRVGVSMPAARPQMRMAAMRRTATVARPSLPDAVRRSRPSYADLGVPLARLGRPSISDAYRRSDPFAALDLDVPLARLGPGIPPAIRRSRYSGAVPQHDYADYVAFDGLGGLGALTLGTLATRDYIMSKASLVASNILLQATAQKTAAAQLRVIRAGLNKVQSGLAQQFDQKMALTPNANLQGVFDTIRVLIANVFTSEGIQEIKAMVAAVGGGALGQTTTPTSSPDYTGSDIACALMAGASAGTSIVGAVTGTSATAITGATNALNNAGTNFCGARTAANTAAATDAQNQTTAANLQIAQLQAGQNAQNVAAAAAQQAASESTMTTLALIGGGIVIAGIVGFAVIKKL